MPDTDLPREEAGRNMAITLIPLWEHAAEFNKLMEEIRGYTVVSKMNCFMLYQFSKQVAALSGDVAEVGVYKGGTSRLLAKTTEATNRVVHSFDTFSGLPQPDPGKDLHHEGQFNVSLENVKTYLSDCKNVRLYPGFFPDTADGISKLLFSLVHIDVDIYQSVMDSCIFFYPRLEKSGIMVFDDYGFLSCPGAKMAVDEFFDDKPEVPCYLYGGQAIVIKV